MTLPIHREGWPFIGIALAVNLLLLLLAGWGGIVLLPITLWVIAFFRDPDRTPPAGKGIICPADGKLLPIVNAEPPSELGMEPGARIRLSIFMNVFDVHVNRIPANGTITALAYRPGKFINASFDKASVDNERMAIRLRLENAKEIAFVQIAGLIARRIKCYLKDGDAVRRGERFGIIRFGSRVDVYLPAEAKVRVNPGQRVWAGQTVLADLTD